MLSILVIYWCFVVFVFGTVVGSFLNVAIARLPLEKSLIWPSSRCGGCMQAIRWYDNLPLISYLWLRGRCRTCGQSYSASYLLVELGTGLGFVGMFLAEVVFNIHNWPGQPAFYRLGQFPYEWWLGFLYHSVLFSMLMVASVCDLRTREIPLQVTLFGTVIGLVGATLLPWPWPHDAASATPAAGFMQAAELGWRNPMRLLPHGVYSWPFWGPLPDGFAPGGNWQTGLATGLLGALAGTFLLRGIGYLFSAGLGKEALGLGDADLMMMAGAFLGWQLVVVAFFLSVLPALLFGLFQIVFRNDNSLPFAPSLSIGVMTACLGWKWFDATRVLFFWGEVLFWLVLAGAGLLFLTSYMLRLMRS